jgi:hypothetical protein
VTCDEIRESLSAHLDETLGAEERARVDGHLETCAECRRELAGLSETVALLRRVQPARAPVGFADRVIAAARRRPWPRRVLEALFLPLSMKLPLEVTAAVMVGLLAVYLFERTPELRQAARPEAVRPEPAPAPGKQQPTGQLADRSARLTVSADAPPPAPAPAPSAGARERRDVAQEAGPSTTTAPPASAASAPPTPASEAKEAAARGAAPGGAVAPEAESRPPALPRSVESPRTAASSPGLAAKRALPSADVVARVAVKDRDAAERELAALIARVGGSVARRRVEEGATVVDALIPQPRYAEFSDGLARLGAWQVESERLDLPARVRVILRLQ